MGNRKVSLALVVLSLVSSAAAKTKVVEIFLKPHPSELQNGGSCSDKSRDKCPEIAFLRDGEVQVIQHKKGIVVAGEISRFSSGQLAALLLVSNLRQNSVEVVPEKVFLIDSQGRPHLPIPDYAAKTNVAEEHHLPPFSPPAYERTYTVTHVPLDSRAPVPPNPSQPQFTIFMPQIAEHDNSNLIAGYEIGYLIGALISSRDAKKQIQWIDRNWLHHKTLADKEFQIGYLPFAGTKDLIPRSDTDRQESSKPIEKQPQRDWVDELLVAKSPQVDDSMKLLVFVEDQQFVLAFGPEVLERRPR